MNVSAVLLVMLMNVHFCLCCSDFEAVLFCSEIPAAFSPGYSILLMSLKDAGEINSTAFHSENLASVTELRIESAGVSGIAEGAFSSFQNLVSLKLNQNLLTEVNPLWLGRPDVLTELSLADNHLEVVDDTMFNRFPNLTSLSLRNNRIRTLHPNSFSSHTNLTVLDLSQNRMTQVSPQVFRSLRSTRIRLDGNPWDCSCGAEDFVDFLTDLQSRSQLDRAMEVTCESPPLLSGQPVWNVSVCATSPPRPPSTTQTVQPRSTDVVTLSPASTFVTPGRPAPPPTETKTATTLTSHTASHVTSPPSVMEMSVHPKPSNPPTTWSPPTRSPEPCVTSGSPLDTNIVLTLVAVIVVLSLLLLVVCFLVVLHKRKRNSKTVSPGRQEGPELKEDGRSRRSPSSGHSEKRDNNEWDLETGWRRSFTGVRAKSANAILYMSPLREAVKVSEQSQSQDAHNVGDETGVDGGVQTQQTADGAENAKQTHMKLDGNSHRVSVNTDAVPYLSIGTNLKQPSPGDVKESTGQKLGRVSTWPPTALQWQLRCQMNEDQTDAPVFSVWTQKVPAEAESVLKNDEGPSMMEDPTDETKPNKDALIMTVAPVKLGLPLSPEPENKTTCFSEAPSPCDSRLEEQLKEEEEEEVQDLPTLRHTLHPDEGNPGPHQDLESAKKTSSTKAERRGEAKRAVTSRLRAQNTSTDPKAPSGGASPDDKTLLSGNDYAFMDLLHEVVQNNGRWTRERWRQIHVDKQRQHRRPERGDDTGGGHMV